MTIFKQGLVSVVGLLLASFPAGTVASVEQSELTRVYDEPGDWPERGRPEALLQATRCAGVSARTTQVPSGTLLKLEDLPPCLQPAFAAVAAAMAEGAGQPPAKAVVRVRIARQFYEASAYYQPRNRQVVFLPAEIEPILNVLQREWPNYASADGELGWSGFLVVIEGHDVRIRVMADEPRPADVWLHSGEILGEFFPGLSVQPVVS